MNKVWCVGDEYSYNGEMYKITVVGDEGHYAYARGTKGGVLLTQPEWLDKFANEVVKDTVPPPAQSFDPISKPDYYNDGAVRSIDAIKSALSAEQFKGYLLGSMMSYLWRCGRKDDDGGKMDIGKTLVFGQWLKEFLDESG